MIEDILTEKIERNVFVNEEESVSGILINKIFLLFSHPELLISIAILYGAVLLIREVCRWLV